MKFELITLTYALSALSPTISETTMQLHHGKHLQTYVTNLNNLIVGTPFETKSLEEIVATSEGAIFNNAGQVLNHNIYFTTFSPKQVPLSDGKLKAAINAKWGSFENFQKEFVNAGVTLFGSGWVWLSKDSTGALEITKEPNASNPVRTGRTPLIGFDVWEHAYYVDYQNRRADHLNSLWQIIDWSVVEARFSK